MKLNSINDFIAWNVSNFTIAFKTIYVDITGDLVAGLLLSQIIYWFLPGENGKSKLRIEKKARYWLCKSRTEWYKEIRITERQYDRAAKILGPKTEYNEHGLGIIDIETFKFNGTPKIHIALNFDILLGLLNEELKKYSHKDNNFVPKKPKKPIKKVDEKEAMQRDKVNNYLSKRTEEYREVFEEFKKYRKKKHPMTTYAEYLMLNELEKYFPQNEAEHIRRFKYSIEHTYTGVIWQNEKDLINGKNNREGY